MTQTLVEARWDQARAQLMNGSELYILFFLIIPDMAPLEIPKRLPFRDCIMISPQ